MLRPGTRRALRSERLAAKFMGFAVGDRGGLSDVEERPKFVHIVSASR
jgi:hypothetical protein